MGLFSKLFRRSKQEEHPYCSVIIAAAGSSSRMGGENKLMQPVDGIPVLARTLMAVNAAALADEIVVAAREEDLLAFGELCKIYGVTKPVKIVRGGASRLESVYRASLECQDKAAFLAVHDGARPLASPELIDRTITLAYRTNAAAPGVPVKDTIKIVRDGKVESTPDREALRAIQTPQVFDAALLRGALQAAVTAGEEVTDDCAAVERLGKEIYLTEGSYENIKITTPEDLLLAEEILRRWEEEA
ncbi:MAG: 2-C-methyl-D-erythritol 4-phosphate cytidylyltransferase [Oscillospiraceae bacterium]|nr:2-C-methyl-D-erythritol 4-phosphate cytidylyltransferase [Oscillospiraceae bacterium]